MPDLSLVEAFRRCGPPVDDPLQDEIRRAAIAIVYQRLRTLIASREDADAVCDIAARLMLRLIQNGPRPDSAQETDELVDAYLLRSIKNGYVDRHRASRKTDQLDVEPSSLLATRAQRRDPADLARASAAIAWAIERLFGAVAAGCSPSTQAAIALRRRVAEGRCSFDDCVREAAGEVTKQSRDALYQRQCRAMRELRSAIESHVAAESLDAWQANSLAVVFQELRDADAGWPVGEEPQP